MVLGILWRWGRVGRSTWLVILVAAGFFALVNLAGERDFLWEEGVFNSQRCDHGWPLVYLHREYNVDEDPMAFLNQVDRRVDRLSVWPTCDPYVQCAVSWDLRPLALLADVVVAAGVIGVLAMGWEAAAAGGVGVLPVHAGRVARAARRGRDLLRLGRFRLPGRKNGGSPLA